MLSLPGLASLAKVLIAMETKIIPANLHYKTPNPNIPGLKDGRLKVIVENTPWSGGLVGINSFGFGGSNVHVILKSTREKERLPHTASASQRLVTSSAHTEQGLQRLLEHSQQNATNIELHALTQETATSPSSSHPYRGYALLNTPDSAQEIQASMVERKASVTHTSIWMKNAVRQ